MHNWDDPSKSDKPHNWSERGAWRRKPGKYNKSDKAGKPHKRDKPC